MRPTPARLASRLALLFLFFPVTLPAQTNDGASGSQVNSTPLIRSIQPAGATIGTRAQWVVRGENLDRVARWLVEGEGVEIRLASDPENSSERVRLEVRVGPEAGAAFRHVRALGVGGLSNLSIVRIDDLSQLGEIEPNDQPETAQSLDLDQCVSGSLRALDRDYFRIEARAGEAITVEIEAQRLGTPIVPVLTVLDPQGGAITRAMETRGIDHDARVTFRPRQDGPHTISVHDNLYAGADGASYRLRVTRGRAFATGLFPLGGPAGRTIEVEASSGGLEFPLTKSIDLPETPGLTLDPGTFEGPEGPVSVPMRLIAGTADEIDEQDSGEARRIDPGQVANGRLSAPGEVDRYLLAVKKGDVVGVRVRAAELGSWLDSVVRVIDATGEELAENDDAGIDSNDTSFQPFNPNQTPGSPDSRLTFKAEKDGDVTVEVADRYGEGGPEYAYRLEVGRGRPDFRIRLLFGDPNLARRQARIGRGRQAPRLPGANGSLNLKPGTTTVLQFLLAGDGGLGEVIVEAEGLPPGVTAAPVKIKPPPFANPDRPLPPSGGAIVLRVAADAEPEIGMLRVVGHVRSADGREIRRVASGTILLEGPDVSSPGSPSIPVSREVEELAACVVGDLRPRSGRGDYVGPPTPLAVSIAEVDNPGVVFQGGPTDLKLTLDPPSAGPNHYRIAVESEGKGLELQTIIPESAPLWSAANGPSAIVRAWAMVDATPGEVTIHVRLDSSDGGISERAASIAIRPPFSLEVAPETVKLDEGGRGELRVRVTRHPGLDSDAPVVLQLDLPEEMEVADPDTLTVPADGSETTIPLRLIEGVQRPEEPIQLSVIGTIQMPRGNVKVEAAERPMLSAVPADN